MHDSHLRRDLPDQAKKLASLKFTREQELEADRAAADMLVRAGFWRRVCQEALEFMHRSVADGAPTDAESTHPGYDDRIAAIRTHDDGLLSVPPNPQPSTQVSYAYNASDNLLTLSPQPKRH